MNCVKRLLLVTVIALVGCHRGPAARRTHLDAGSSPRSLAREIANRAVPQFMFGRSEAMPAVIFASLRPAETEQGFVPSEAVILIGTLEGWEVKRLGLEHDGWVYAATTADRQRAWAIADTVDESAGPELEIFMSDDGGRRWRHRSTVTKPHYTSVFEALRLGPGGVGVLALRLWHPVDNLVAGRYLYRTADGSLSWGAPQFESEITVPAWQPRGTAGPSLNAVMDQALLQR
jgi:hypothetical protein